MRMMSSPTPQFALAFVRELSADFRAGIVVDETGRTLAGEATLSDPAATLLAAHPDARELHGSAEDGTQVFAARADGLAMVIVTGPHALPGLTGRDMRTALFGTGVKSAQEAPPARPDRTLIDPLTTAAADAFRP
jgi:hypothetical protein